MTSSNDPAIQDRGTSQVRHRKARDRSVALLLLGGVLLLPPIGAIFRLDTTLFGVPFPLAYIFVVWVLLIVGGALLVKALQDGDVPHPITDPTDVGD
jgi:hypothetical protein